MAFWGFIPEMELVRVGALPAGAFRRDTGLWVDDVEKWAAACRYYDLDSPTVAADFKATRNPTKAEFDALVAQVTAVVNERNNKRTYVLDRAAEWTPARTTLATWLDAVRPADPVARLDNLLQAVEFLVNVNIKAFDLTITMAHSQIGLIEQSETFEIPPIILP